MCFSMPIRLSKESWFNLVTWELEKRYGGSGPPAPSEVLVETRMLFMGGRGVLKRELE